MPVKYLVLLAALLLQGCAFQQWKVNNIAAELRTGTPQQALAAMQAIKPPRRDRAQYLLNLGMLKHLNGDIRGSIADLQAAKRLIATLQAASVRESLGASTVNETLRSYRGSPAEAVMLQQLLALNYLALGDLDGARVEVLQADVLMREPAHKGSLSGQLASMRFVAGVVFELGREWDSAMIAYRKAAQLMAERKQQLPRALQDSLLRMSLKLGLRDEYRQFTRRFGRKAQLPKGNQAEVIAFYWQGVVSAKVQTGISVYAPQLQHQVSLAVPAYPAQAVPYSPSALSLGQASQTTQLLDNLELLVREDLAEEITAIKATTLLRAVAKHQAIKSAQKQDGAGSLLGLLGDITATLTEVADVRSWSTLPANIQVARQIVPAGTYSVHLGSGQRASELRVSLRAGETGLLLKHSVSRRWFVYGAQTVATSTAGAI
ncbi:MAG: hypothetical protein CSA54_03340 [Gammaproteobacteria bacterium]|nr:MAG: hypothetical protein CSA54_03340 [Gammaproteobacteria bacterium]